MLTFDLVKPFLRVREEDLTVDLLDESEEHWLETARELIALFQQQSGRPRSAWERVLEEYEGARIDYLRIRGLALVLTQAATFAPKSFPIAPRDIRQRLFERGPVFAAPDMFRPQTRQDTLRQVAAELELSAETVEDALFADHPGAHVLVDSGPAWTPEQLVQRYNLELARGALYRATDVQLDVHDNYKEIWRYLKLFKIMFMARELPEGGYRVRLSGPLSDFVETERYGISFAAFLPAVLLGQRWNLLAKVRHPAARVGGEERFQDANIVYRLDQDCGLHSYYRRGREFDSKLERVFASEFTDFEEKFGGERGKWRLQREEHVLVLDGSVMIPDFVLIHTQDENRRVLVELVGYWSPRYLQNKIAKVKAVQCPNLLLLVYEELKVTKEDFRGAQGDVLFFKQKPVLKEVMAAVESLAERVYGPLERRRSVKAEPK